MLLCSCMEKLSTEHLHQIDHDGFCAELTQLRDETFQGLAESDFKHLIKIERWGRLATIIGFATAWIFPNPLSVVAMTLGLMTRWLLMHHIGHGGYDRVPGVPKRYTSKHFAVGGRRFLDWFDWMQPEAWKYEHNHLHHYHTGECSDPDVVERNARIVRDTRCPKFLKYIALFLFAITWKFTYYAPNTLNALKTKEAKKKHRRYTSYITPGNFLNIFNPLVRKLWLECYLPYITFQFVVIPALFLPLGSQAVYFVLINRLLAEALTNFHAFMVIGPNHTGEDLYCFNYHFRNKKQFYVNQVLGSVNYSCGGELIDYSQMWLNYQIEHHLIPNLPMSTYRKIQPKVKSLCERYGVPYVQESVFKRFKKMSDIFVGNRSMMYLDHRQFSDIPGDL